MHHELICLPFAGGSATVYYSWQKWFKNISVYPVEYAGRGQRLDEPLYPDLKSAVIDVLNVIKPRLLQYPYALFGHSMGAAILFELVHQIQNNTLPLPKHAFLSGCDAPHIKSDFIFHTSDEKRFQQEIIELGGMPAEIFEYPELVQICLNILKSDIKNTQTHDFTTFAPLTCNISVFNGQSDHSIAMDRRHEWRQYTMGSYNQYLFSGNHFFIQDNMEKIAAIIKHTLENAPRKQPNLQLQGIHP
ncbi:thioesterase [candidate division KSB1 bacterium]|nr:thioesterase [candidate division KSB1 bacterium]